MHLFNAFAEPLYTYYDGTRLGRILGGEVVNCDFPFGTLVRDAAQSPYADPDVEVSLSGGIALVKKEYTLERVEKSFQFYSPRGYGTWAGNVMNFYHNGVYHLMFLQDRHHHGSRFGGETEAVLAIDSRSKTAQINDSEEKILPLYELIKQRKGDKNAQNIHRRGHSFASGR